MHYIPDGTYGLVGGFGGGCSSVAVSAQLKGKRIIIEVGLQGFDYDGELPPGSIKMPDGSVIIRKGILTVEQVYGKQVKYVSFEAYDDKTPSVNPDREDDPKYDPETFLADEDMVTADGVRLAMTYEEVLAIIGKPDAIFDNKEDYKSIKKNGYIYGFHKTTDSFPADYPLPHDDNYYLKNIRIPDNCTDPLPRGIRIGEKITDVLDKFPTQNLSLTEYDERQAVYGKQEDSQPRAFLEYNKEAGSFRLFLTTSTQVLNINFDNQNKVQIVEFEYFVG